MSSEDSSKKPSSRVNFMLQEASKLEVSSISQVYNCVRQRMMDLGLLEDNRNLRNVIDAPWLDDEAIQLKLYFEEAVSLWTTWPTPDCAQRIQSIRQQLNDKLLDLRQKWEEKINSCRTMDSRNAEKALKMTSAQYKELLLFTSGEKTDPSTSSSNRRNHYHGYHPYYSDHQQQHKRHPRHHYQHDSFNVPQNITQHPQSQPISYYVPNAVDITRQDTRRIHGATYQNYFHGS
ncbi:hypothetical protein EWB00_001335 [Schistosoma japonicum]|uniref:Uncharacterized protein n=2 Tax=Schistosoma japonicum TaxID=6182 RepID=A0A4Z2DFW5_SCHJA|nr:hypothetical protein KSF78_0008614 [Schistosoma japonicum]KAH8857579.1 hypothetical protein KSF78_0008614 [Schistosoma japonicum]TNN15356.1 hypothetical protein EWB00_001335 [Schistosoma japonicum]TNN15357.1 hypothetical protein EWB00_001335 [Schistosoma japonicum]